MPSLPTAIIVAYGQPDQLEACLVRLTGVRATIVIDNSSDPRIRELAQRHAASYEDPGRNLGFAAAVNRGIAAAPSDADVLLVNPDAVVDEAVVTRLSQTVHSGARVAAAAPALCGPDGTPQRPAWPVPTPGGVWLDALGLGRLRRRPMFLVGAVLLLNRAALAELGGFDERFFLYAEESDWQLRALRAGWSLALVDDVT